jgi:hypothetical protein
MFLVASVVGYSQTPTTAPGRPETPVYKVQIWGDIVAEFTARIRRYSDLRSELEVGLPRLRVTDDPREIKRAERAFAKKSAVRATAPRKGTVPPNILARLPILPDDLQYRFVGPHLILHDTRANLILDRIPYAIRCADCHTQSSELPATLEHKKCRISLVR